MITIRQLRYLGALARFVRFVGELSGEQDPVMPRLPFAPLTEELASSAATLATGWRRQRASIDNLATSAQAIVDGLPDPLIGVDRQRRIVRTNRAARALLGQVGAERDLSTALRQPELLAAIDRLLEAGAEVPYVGTATPRTPWNTEDEAWLKARGTHVQFRATLEQDVAAMREVRPDLALGTTPLVQKAKELAVPALYFTNMVSARPLFGPAGAAALVAVIEAQAKGKERFSRMLSFFDPAAARTAAAPAAVGEG